jgi:DAK2 domain fusion protein YloV
MTATDQLSLVAAAADALKDRKDEVNRLNVFPVPDGDTGTNMSLTMDSVVRELEKLSSDADIKVVCHAITHGSLMGARGNSGVILSQILRGLCEGIDGAETFDAATLAAALERSKTVAFQAVRKPVEGTMLTVLKDTAAAAQTAAEQGMELPAALAFAIDAAFASVDNTPELLPVLKENGVVDAGGFGLAILFDGFVSAFTGSELRVSIAEKAALMSVVPVDDWDDDEYLYCTEFLLFGPDIDRDEVGDFVASKGGSELVVGGDGEYKVHVHTNDPGSVLSKMTDWGEVAEVHINNMRRQTKARDELLRADSEPAPPVVGPQTTSKPVGFVAVASGDGLAKILESLGVDEVVSGGQTMNPSTEDLLGAIQRVPAKQVIVLPNNKNIVMAANAAAGVAGKHVAVVPTTSVPQAFSAMIAYDGTSEELDAIVSAMTDAAHAVRTGEITTAVKDAKGKVGNIKEGQVIGIADHEIVVAGDVIEDVALDLAKQLAGEDAETLTILAGADFDDERLASFAESVEAALPDLDVQTLRGEQPLYPIIMAAE